VFCPTDGARLENAAASADDPYLGTTIAGDIRLTEVIGAGAMGRVYRAQQGGIGRDVAVKILLRELSSNAQLVRRFEREAKIASKLRHPHVVEVHLVGQLPDGSLYIVMEYLDGVSLATALEMIGGVMPLDRMLGIIVQICDAVGEAHAQGIVHRDLKPENVMLVRRAEMEDWVKVLDFGIAKGSVGGSSMHTASGHIFGTPRYISPEGVKGGDVNPASDVYSLATVAYQMLSGRTPFEGDQAMDLLVKHVHDSPPDLRSLERARSVPESVARIIMDNLDKDPAKRLPNARAFGTALALATKTAGIAVNDVGAFTRMSRDDIRPTLGLAPTLNDEPPIDLTKPAAAAPTPSTQSTGESLAAKIPLNRSGFRSPWLWIALAFALGSVVTMAAWRIVHRDAGGPDRAALIDQLRKALDANHYVSPPGDNVRELLASGLARWPDDPALLEIRFDAERSMVTRAMAEHSGGDVIGAYTVAQHAVEIDPTNRSATLLNDEYGAEVRLLTADAAVITGSPCVLFDPPATATTGTTIDLTGHVMLRSAGTRATIASPKITVREDRDAVNARDLPLSQSGSSTFVAKLAVPTTPKKLYLTFEATVDGTLMRAERSVEVH
jgi:serine/threonine-protein kinase